MRRFSGRTHAEGWICRSQRPFSLAAPEFAGGAFSRRQSGVSISPSGLESVASQPYNRGLARLKLVAAVLCLVCCAGYYLKMNVWDLLPGIDGSPSDFGHYYRAAFCVTAAHSPYVDPNFDYPPAVAFLFAPFARTDYVTARRIWFWCSHVCLLLAAYLTWRALGRGGLAACLVACVWALGGAAREGLALGQLGPLLVLLLVLAYWRTGAGQGAALAAGFALKFIPGPVAVVPLLRRDWRAAVTFAALGAAGVAIPLAAIAHWNSGPAVPTSADYWMGTPAVLNWSIPAVALRIADPPVAGGALPRNWQSGNGPLGLHLPRAQQWLSAGIAAALLLAGVAALMIVCRGRLNPAQAPWAAAALISLAVAASPISWNHYQILQYPALALLLYRAAAERRCARITCGTMAGRRLRPPRSTSGLRWRRWPRWRCSPFCCVNWRPKGRLGGSSISRRTVILGQDL
jgi:hypothetical protein